MNAGIELLLERMKTHPEEFYVENQLRMGSSKWTNLWQMYQDYFSEEDKKSYIDGLKAVNQQRFTEHVLEGLVDPKHSSGAENQYATTPIAMPLGGATHARSSVTLNNTNTITNIGAATGTVTLPNGSITLGNTTLSEVGLKQILATHRAMREETKPKRWWNKSIPELLGGNK